jgi:hypothetical protein
VSFPICGTTSVLPTGSRPCLATAEQGGPQWLHCRHPGSAARDSSPPSSPGALPTADRSRRCSARRDGYTLKCVACSLFGGAPTLATLAATNFMATWPMATCAGFGAAWLGATVTVASDCGCRTLHSSLWYSSGQLRGLLGAHVSPLLFPAIPRLLLPYS